DGDPFRSRADGPDRGGARGSTGRNFPGGKGSTEAFVPRGGAGNGELLQGERGNDDQQRERQGGFGFGGHEQGEGCGGLGSGSGKRLGRGGIRQCEWCRLGGLGGESGGQRRDGKRSTLAAQDAGELV